MIFGKGRDKGVRLNPQTLTLEVVTLGADGVSEVDLLVHDETNHTITTLLAAMEPPHLPVAHLPEALGVLYCDPAPSYEAAVRNQIAAAQKTGKSTDLNALLRGGHTWTVAG